MSPVYQNIRLVRGAHWLIQLRWLAIVGVVVANVVSSNVLNVQVAERSIYAVAALLALYNAGMLVGIKYVTRGGARESNRLVTLSIDVQILLDLVALTALLHFSGGIENPFLFFFVFHMCIASILLSVRESYLHATLAILLFGLMVTMEEEGLVAHYCLMTEFGHFPYSNAIHVFGTILALGLTLYLVVYMTSSITVRLRYREQAYREANIQLEQKDRVKDEYVARVTHDIKGDLAAIQSCLDVVGKKMVGPLNERQDEFVGRAQKRTKKLTRFVRSLLELTQMRLSHSLEMEAFALSDTIISAVASVNSRASVKSIGIDVSVDNSIGQVKGNQFSIEELVANLLLNAIKYTPDGGSIKVEAREVGVFAEVSIIDTGIGISDDEIDHVFEEFYRGSNARKSVRDGTGLGLSIAKQIVKRHDGHIWAKSKLGEGTTLRFTLPMSKG